MEHSVVIWSMYKHNDKLSAMCIAISLDFYYLVLGAIEYFIQFFIKYTITSKSLLF